MSDWAEVFEVWWKKRTAGLTEQYGVSGADLNWAKSFAYDAWGEAYEQGKAELLSSLLCDKHRHMSVISGCRYCAYERGRAEASEPLPCGHPRACQRIFTCTHCGGHLPMSVEDQFDCPHCKGTGIEVECAWCADKEARQGAQE
jgi:hypothetical protein